MPLSGRSSSKGSGFLGLLMRLFGVTAKTCDEYAGYISLYYTLRRLFGLVVVALALRLANMFLKGATRIQTTITSVQPDTHVLHEFPEARIVPRPVTKSRRVRRGKTYRTEPYTVTVYDVTNLIGPNGEPMGNDLKDSRLVPRATPSP